MLCGVYVSLPSTLYAAQKCTVPVVTNATPIDRTTCKEGAKISLDASCEYRCDQDYVATNGASIQFRCTPNYEEEVSALNAICIGTL